MCGSACAAQKASYSRGRSASVARRNSPWARRVEAPQADQILPRRGSAAVAVAPDDVAAIGLDLDDLQRRDLPGTGVLGLQIVECELRRLGEVAGTEAHAEVDHRLAFEDLVHLVCRVPGRMAKVVDHASA